MRLAALGKNVLSCDNLKAVRSIWICMDTADDEDSIKRLHFVQETLYGKDIEFTNLDKV